MYLRMAEVSLLETNYIFTHIILILMLCNEIDQTGSQERDMDLVEVLSFLFMLSTMELGQVCNSDHYLY
jgi:hypothetical protein